MMELTHTHLVINSKKKNTHHKVLLRYFCLEHKPFYYQHNTERKNQKRVVTVPFL
ncbi:hypothetical protein Peur_004999 [Populus x canadensis]